MIVMVDRIALGFSVVMCVPALMIVGANPTFFNWAMLVYVAALCPAFAIGLHYAHWYYARSQYREGLVAASIPLAALVLMFLVGAQQ